MKPAADPAGRDVDADPDADAADHVAPGRPADDAGVAARGRQPGRAAAAHHPPHSTVLAAVANHSGMKFPVTNLRLLPLQLSFFSHNCYTCSSSTAIPARDGDAVLAHVDGPDNGDLGTSYTGTPSLIWSYPIHAPICDLVNIAGAGLVPHPSSPAGAHCSRRRRADRGRVLPSHPPRRHSGADCQHAPHIYICSAASILLGGNSIGSGRFWVRFSGNFMSH